MAKREDIILKYADKRQSPVVVIEGGDEKDRGVVQIKDMVLGAQLAQEASHDEWKERPNQYEVPRGDLVARSWGCRPGMYVGIHAADREKGGRRGIDSPMADQRRAERRVQGGPPPC